MAKKVLITGATSKTGEAVTRLLRNETDYELLLVSSKPDRLPENKNIQKFSVNAADRNKLRKLCLQEKPEIIINTAAMNDVDGAETNKKLAWAMNVETVENLTRISTIIEAHFITFSTDYIFNGISGPYDEYAKPDPISYYGKTKHAGENAAITGCDTSTVIRTNVVYGYSSYGKNDFIRWIIENLELGRKLKIIKGQYCNPTFTDDLARVVDKVIKKQRFGVYNAAGADWMNRFDIAERVAEVFDLDKNLISELPKDKLIQKAKRPEKGGLITLKAETDLGISFSSLENGLHSLKYQMERFNSKFDYIS